MHSGPKYHNTVKDLSTMTQHGDRKISPSVLGHYTTTTKTSIRYAKENDREREKRERKRKVEGET